MAESPRIEELKRRVQVDPASIAFAALAEEYRRAGRFEEAIATCEAGLQRHPAYLSAHVTLGRALIELGRFDEARDQLQHVLRAAPENLAAIRGLADIHHRRGELPEALEQYKSALHVVKHDAELEQTVEQISKQVAESSPEAAETAAPASEEPAAAQPNPQPIALRKLELVTWQTPAAHDPEPEPAEPEISAQPERDEPPQIAAAAEAPEIVEAALEPEPPHEPEPAREPEPDPALAALEGFLAAILREKSELTAAGR